MLVRDAFYDHTIKALMNVGRGHLASRQEVTLTAYHVYIKMTRIRRRDSWDRQFMPLGKLAARCNIPTWLVSKSVWSVVISFYHHIPEGSDVLVEAMNGLNSLLDSHFSQ